MGLVWREGGGFHVPTHSKSSQPAALNLTLACDLMSLKTVFLSKFHKQIFAKILRYIHPIELTFWLYTPVGWFVLPFHSFTKPICIIWKFALSQLKMENFTFLHLSILAQKLLSSSCMQFAVFAKLISFRIVKSICPT